MAFQSDGGIGKARKLVEGVIKGLGLVPDECTIEAAEGAAAWQVARGSAYVMVALNPGREGAPARLRLVSPIVRTKYEVAPAMLMRLLELNGTELPGIAFGMIGDKIVLLTERSVTGLDKAEVEELLHVIGVYADKYDDELVNQFGGTRVCDTE